MSVHLPYAPHPTPIISNLLSMRLNESVCYQFLMRRKNDVPLDLFDCSPHWHDFIQIWYIKSGEYIDLIGNKYSKVPPGNFVVVPPYCIHAPCFYASNTIDTICCDFSIEFLDLLLQDPQKTSLFLRAAAFCFTNGIPLQIDVAKRAEFEAFLYDLTERYEENPHKSIVLYKDQINTFLHFVLQEMLSKSTVPPLEKGEKTTLYYSQIIKKISNYIDEHYREKITLKELAEYVAITPTHLCRIFKTLTGNTLFEHINQVRLSHASFSLTCTDSSITDIAKTCGFSNDGYFHRQFRSVLHTTPRQYRILSRQYYLHTEQQKKYVYSLNQRDSIAGL